MKLVSLSHFLHGFCRKIFLILYSINWTNCIIVLLSLLLEILGGMCVVTTCFPVNYIMNFEIKLCFSSSCFPVWPESSGQKFQRIKNKKWFCGKIKSIFSLFWKGFHRCKQLQLFARGTSDFINKKAVLKEIIALF